MSFTLIIWRRYFCCLAMEFQAYNCFLSQPLTLLHLAVVPLIQTKPALFFRATYLLIRDSWGRTRHLHDRPLLCTLASLTSLFPSASFNCITQGLLLSVSSCPSQVVVNTVEGHRDQRCFSHPDLFITRLHLTENLQPETPQYHFCFLSLCHCLEFLHPDSIFKHPNAFAKPLWLYLLHH